MKKISFLAALLLTIALQSFAQEKMTFSTRYRVYIPGNKKFPILYSKDKTPVQKVSGVIIKPLKIEVDTFKTVTKEWLKGDSGVLDTLDIIKNKRHKYLYADILQSEEKDKLYIYFWPFKDSEQADTATKKLNKSDSSKKAFNDLLEKGSFYIQLKERQTLSLTKAAWHLGALTMPLKVYVTSRDTGHANNVTADVNAGFYLGWKWGSETFRNLPGEKTAVTHQKFWSFNFIGGLSKIDISSKTNIKGDAREGTAIGFSPAFGFGYHYDSFAIFLAAGTDIPFGNITENWRYKYQPWLGFGVGFSIL